MAPAPSPVPVHSPNSPPSRYLRRLHRQASNLSRHLPKRSLPSHFEKSKARILDSALQPSVVPEGPPPPPIAPSPSSSLVAPGPMISAAPAPSNLPQEASSTVDMPGNVLAAIVVIVLILGGLIGLVVGGELLRRRAKKTMRKGVHPSPTKSSGRWKSQTVKHATGSPPPRFQISHEVYACDEKTLTPLARPAPVLGRERQRRLSDVWPIRRLSTAMSHRRSCPEQLERNVPPSLPGPKVDLQTTWSGFSPVSFYVAPTRTVLTCIPEELEDCHNQSNSDIEAILGVTIQRPLESGSAVSQSSHSVLLDCPYGPDSPVATERCSMQDGQVIHKARTSDEDVKSLGSSAPDMTSDGGESSRSSMVSLESLGDGNDKTSLREEVFELRRAQTRSMQMNKGVLLSLSLKDLDDSQNDESIHEECNPSRARSSCATETDVGKICVEREVSLAILGGNFTAVELDEFPSPPSMLPMIPSFVSSF